MAGTSFLEDDELEEMGFGSIGRDVKISRHAMFYNAERISMGSHVRIDDFCVLSACRTGFISIGDYVHIAAHCLIEAPAGVTFMDFSGLAARCTVYGGTDDYLGEYLTNPCVLEKYRKCYRNPVVFGRHAVVGAGTTILQGVTLGDGCAVGSMSLVLRDVPPGQVHAGIPAKYIKDRSGKIFELERQLREEEDPGGGLPGNSQRGS
jgi:galactoside O-acetyltransferase